VKVLLIRNFCKFPCLLSVCYCAVCCDVDDFIRVRAMVIFDLEL
jgi:hypothetical protein